MYSGNGLFDSSACVHSTATSLYPAYRFGCGRPVGSVNQFILKSTMNHPKATSSDRDATKARASSTTLIADAS